MHSLLPSSNEPVMRPRLAERIPASQPDGPPTSDSGAPTVLIVEDSDIVSDFLQSACEAYGYHALIAATPDEAIDHCRRERIHALIADVRLGSFDGFETAQMLMKMCPGMKVVFTSGYPYDYLVQMGRLPANLPISFLQKPFPPSEIISVLKSLRRLS